MISLILDLDAQKMKKQNIRKLILFDRGNIDIDGEHLRGYVLDYSDAWTLIHVVEQDIFFNGYAIFRNDTVKRYRAYDDRGNLTHRALRKLGHFPKSPGQIDLTNFDRVVTTANKLSPLLVIHREFRNKDKVHIGSIAKVSQKTITLSTIGTEAEYDGFYRIRIPDITTISFGGHYETALWAVASKRTKSRIIKESIGGMDLTNK